MPQEFFSNSFQLLDPELKSVGLNDGVLALVPTEIGSIESVYRPIRRGQLLFTDGFESAYNWLTITGTCARTTTAGEVFHGSASLKQTTPATIGSMGRSAIYLHLPPLKRAWLSAFFGGFPSTNVRLYEMALSLNDKATGKTIEGILGYNITDNHWKYQNNTLGNMVTIPNDFSTTFSAAYWHHILLEIDILNAKYGKCCLDGWWTDLSSLPMYSTSITTDFGEMAILVDVITNTANAVSCSWDDIVLTGLLNLV